jgi:hypothetical protein
MLLTEIITVYCENHMKHINAQCEQNAEFLSVESCGAYCYQCALRGYAGSSCYQDLIHLCLLKVFLFDCTSQLDL